MADQLANGCYGFVAGTIDSTQTSIVCQYFHNLPAVSLLTGHELHMTIEADLLAVQSYHEIIKVTNHTFNATTGEVTLTVLRGQRGTTAKAHLAGTFIKATADAKTLETLSHTLLMFETAFPTSGQAASSGFRAGDLGYRKSDGVLAGYSGTAWETLGGGAYVHTIAAADTPVGIRDIATYRCTGTNDEVVIAQAVNAAKANGGGRIEFLEGTFNIDAPITVTNPNNLYFNGKRGATRLIHRAGDAVFELVNSGSNVSFERLTFERRSTIAAGSTTLKGAIHFKSDYNNTLFVEHARIRSCLFRNYGTRDQIFQRMGAIYIGLGKHIKISHCIFQNDSEQSVANGGMGALQPNDVVYCESPVGSKSSENVEIAFCQFARAPRIQLARAGAVIGCVVHDDTSSYTNIGTTGGELMDLTVITLRGNYSRVVGNLFRIYTGQSFNGDGSGSSGYNGSFRGDCIRVLPDSNNTRIDAIMIRGNRIHGPFRHAICIGNVSSTDPITTFPGYCISGLIAGNDIFGVNRGATIMLSGAELYLVTGNRISGGNVAAIYIKSPDGTAQSGSKRCMAIYNYINHSFLATAERFVNAWKAEANTFDCTFTQNNCKDSFSGALTSNAGTNHNFTAGNVT